MLKTDPPALMMGKRRVGSVSAFTRSGRTMLVMSESLRVLVFASPTEGKLRKRNRSSAVRHQHQPVRSRLIGNHPTVRCLTRDFDGTLTRQPQSRLTWPARPVGWLGSALRFHPPRG